MPIYGILQNVAFEPEHVEGVAKAFEDALRELQIDNRHGPESHQLAKAIFEMAQRGERNVDKLRLSAIAKLGFATLPRSDDIRIGEKTTVSPPTILIVEDDEAFAYAAARYFEARGYRSVIASGSLAAFRELDRNNVDIVVADVFLGKNEPHGVSLGRMIRNRDQRMPVVLITAFPELVMREAPLPGPVFAKPVDLAELALAVETSRRAEF